MAKSFEEIQYNENFMNTDLIQSNIYNIIFWTKGAPALAKKLQPLELAHYNQMETASQQQKQLESLLTMYNEIVIWTLLFTPIGEADLWEVCVLGANGQPMGTNNRSQVKGVSGCIDNVYK